MQQSVILFDINETVLNLSVLKPKFKCFFGDECYMDTWFLMLLHLSTVCLATNVTTEFKTLANIALESLAGKLGILLSKDNCDEILNSLSSLPAHEDIKPALIKLRNANFKLVAFSNSSLILLSSQLKNSGLDKYFDDVISVESADTFKPSPKAYQFAVNKLNVLPSQVCLIATHDWDTHGALCAGINAAFINRLGITYNPLYKTPSIIGNTMNEIADKIIAEELLLANETG
jgi:2-haloacid dehalogenase